jgi:hypothetical protein
MNEAPDQPPSLRACARSPPTCVLRESPTARAYERRAAVVEAQMFAREVESPLDREHLLGLAFVRTANRSDAISKLARYEGAHQPNPEISVTNLFGRNT